MFTKIIWNYVYQDNLELYMKRCRFVCLHSYYRKIQVPRKLEHGPQSMFPSLRSLSYFVKTNFTIIQLGYYYFQDDQFKYYKECCLDQALFVELIEFVI